MPSQPKCFAQVALGSSLSTLYTVPGSGVIADMPSILLVNCGTAATVRLYAVAPGDVPQVKNAIAYDVLVEAGETKVLALGVVLGPEWTIQGWASQANIIAMHLNGLEVTP